ncbi:radical SAM protein [bacterium]|nr:radical SAM protein [bacterium]
MITTNSTFSETLLKNIEEFRNLPVEAIIKQDVLRRGLNFSEDALKIVSGYKPKDYFIFTFDLVELKEMKNQENLKAPEEIRIKNGDFRLLPTTISVRINPESPYLVTLCEGKITLTLDKMNLGEVEYHPVPDYYRHEKINGKPIGEICPVIEWGYLLYLTAYRMCQYFDGKEQCQFCDLNTNFIQQRKAGRTYTGIKSIEEILEALNYVNEFDTTAKAYTLTGGSVVTDLQGESEVDFYLKYAEAINNKFPNRWISKAVVQAWTFEDCQKLKNAGVEIYHPNYEVWGKEMFAKICPGKERLIGFENWIERVVRASEVFGAENVIPNFVGGVEMNKQTGFQNIDEAISSTTEGLEFFMSKGIVPRFTTWCPEPLAALGHQESAPLEYFCKLLLAWKNTFEKYKLPSPKGYGEAGIGKAVFSVSAFMDVIGFKEIRN